MRPRVYVTRRIPEAGVRLLRECCEVSQWESDEAVPRAVLMDALRECDGVLAMLTERFDAATLDALPRLKVIANMAVGFDNVDVAAATARGVVVTNTPGVLTETTADFAWTLMMAVARNIVPGYRYVQEGRWTTWGPLLLRGQDVYGATLGLVGLGRIGSGMARRARGFEMRVLYHDAVRREDLEASLGIEFVPLETLLRESDFVSLHVPLTPETHHLIDRERLRMMKPTAILINTARGPVVDSAALDEALREGWIWGAGLDVTDPEPIPLDSPLLRRENCLIVPHIASASFRTRDAMAELAARNLIRVLVSGEPPETPVNPEVWERRRR